MHKIGYFVLSTLMCASSFGATSVNNTNKYAYGANIGWVNFQGDTNNGAVIGQFFCTGYVYSANCGWISLGNGPTNKFQYSNGATNDYGVNHDGAGNLRGFAYGANIGWINFESNGNPRVSLLTGAMGGYAYGANVGWISLSNAFAFVQTDTLNAGPDTDGDGIPDAWEIQQVGNLGDLTAGGDFDADGVKDREEYASDTDPDLITEYLKITDEEVSSGGATATVTWASEPTRLYRVQRSISVTNNATWSDSGLGTVSSDPGAFTTRNVPDAIVTTRYFRVESAVPLAP